MNNILIWLDDCRNPFYGTWINDYSPIYSPKVVWLTSYKEFVVWITENGLPDAICFDHDLGDADYHITNEIPDATSEKTGYDCAKWLIDYCIDNNCDIPKFNIQSSNGPGADNIRGLLTNYHNFYEKA